MKIHFIDGTGIEIKVISISEKEILGKKGGVRVRIPFNNIKYVEEN